MVCAAYEPITPMRTKWFRLQDALLQVDSADEERIEEAQQVCNKQKIKNKQKKWTKNSMPRHLYEPELLTCTTAALRTPCLTLWTRIKQELESLMEIEAMADIPLLILFNKTDLKVLTSRPHWRGDVGLPLFVLPLIHHHYFTCSLVRVEHCSAHGSTATATYHSREKINPII